MDGVQQDGLLLGLGVAWKATTHGYRSVEPLLLEKVIRVMACCPGIPAI